MHAEAKLAKDLAGLQMWKLQVRRGRKVEGVLEEREGGLKEGGRKGRVGGKGGGGAEGRGGKEVGERGWGKGLGKIGLGENRKRVEKSLEEDWKIFFIHEMFEKSAQQNDRKTCSVTDKKEAKL